MSIIHLSLTGSTSVQLQKQEVPTAYNDAYQFHDIMIDNAPTYEEIGENRTGTTVNM